jgi:hypothetical protein
MQSPGIIRPDSRAGVPELGLQELSSRVNEAAAIWSFRIVVAGERTIDGTAWRIAIWYIGS